MNISSFYPKKIYLPFFFDINGLPILLRFWSLTSKLRSSYVEGKRVEIKGVMEYTDLNQTWHKVDSNNLDTLPEDEGSLCLIELITNAFVVAEYYKPRFERKIHSGEAQNYDPNFVKRWAYLKDLLPKGGEK